jgi:hypothetical protein
MGGKAQRTTAAGLIIMAGILNLLSFLTGEDTTTLLALLMLTLLFTL